MKFFKWLLFVILTSAVIWINLPTKVGKQPVGQLFGQNYFSTHLGLDLKGGSHLVFQADTRGVRPQDLEEALNSSRDIIERRVNFFGVSEPSIQTLKVGDVYRITVDLPGVENSAQAIDLIGQTAQLAFREEQPLNPQFATLAALMKSYKPTPALTGKDVKKATVVYDPTTGKPQVQLEFDAEGEKKFTTLTEKNVGKGIGIFIDTQLLSAPTVSQKIIGDTAVITGDFRLEDAKQLAVAINSGALPLPIRLVEQRSIGPTLGAAEIQKSVFAGVVGLTAVMLFMILYYGRLGVIACIGLIVYGALSYAVFRAIPVTLTLSGIAGFILSIGMAVDANILIFERIKEELRKGKDRQSAIRLGFGRAIDAIKDANITTLLVAFILFNPLNWDFLPQFGLVRGFALTLSIGVVMSLFTGVIVTRKLIEVFYKVK